MLLPGQYLLCVVFSNTQHRLTLGEVTVEQPQWPGHEGQVHREPVQAQPAGVKAGLAQKAAVLPVNPPGPIVAGGEVVTSTSIWCET